VRHGTRGTRCGVPARALAADGGVRRSVADAPAGSLPEIGVVALGQRGVVSLDLRLRLPRRLQGEVEKGKACRGRGAYDDIVPGALIKVLDAAGSLVGSGSRGSLSYSFDQLEQDGGTVIVSLGSED
jgi:hypothetical protein